jgi:16S rRNA (adenine1518-N6/adenine1519-N6)-dimethyltransferase
VNLLGRTKLILKKYGIKPKEKLGQNFIVSQDVLERQVKYANISKKDIVLEIGAGIGTLTALLLEKAKKLYVVEKDPVLLKVLRDRFEDVNILEGDALKLRLPKFDKTVSNIPYSISSPLTFKLFRHGFKLAVLTYQKEFAERMVAKPGMRNYSRLSVATFYYANAEILEFLPKDAFYPPPKVESAVVRLFPKKKPFKVNEEIFFKLMRLFTHRRKTVKNALLHSPEIEKEIVLDLIRVFPEIANKRVFELEPNELAEMCRFVENRGVQD